jgi:hypothetical protein
MVVHSVLGRLPALGIEDSITSFIQYVPKDSTDAPAHPLTPWDLAWYLCIPLIPGFLALVFYTAIRQLNRNIENHSVRIFFLYFIVYVFVSTFSFQVQS